MKYVEIIADAGSQRTIERVARKSKAYDFRIGTAGADGMAHMRMLVGDEHLQSALDDLQMLLGAQVTARIVVMPVESSIPKPVETQRKKEKAATEARESLYESVEKSARLDLNYSILVVLSTVVAAIGLLRDNVAVVIGAMVIAPLLGPNLALSLGASLGDVGLMRKAARTIAVGVALSIGMTAILGFFWVGSLESDELMTRTEAHIDSVALALASGAAAALSLTTGLSGVLVGVMVAVALLPPAATAGLMLGHGDMDRAMGASLLLAVNVVCVNIACNLVFLLKGIRPRTWAEKENAQKAMTINLVAWGISLVVLMGFMYLRSLRGA